MDLFSGYGGFSLGLKLALPGQTRTVCYVENAPYPQKILQARIKDGMLDDAPIWDDIQTFDGLVWRGAVDIITAGFPCQPWSLAGRQQGEKDSRNLWPATLQVIRQARPRSVILENVPGLLSQEYFGQILKGLAKSGYDAEWRIVSAAECGAPHIRKRLWMLAYSASPGPQERTENKALPQSTTKFKRPHWWKTEPNIC